MSGTNYKTLRSRATDQEALTRRAANLTAVPTAGRPNGIRLVFVTISGTRATLAVHFYNENYLQAIVDKFTLSGNAHQLFPISGGQRLPAGAATGMVKAIDISLTDPTVLTLKVAPVGDYSTYKLRLNEAAFAVPVVIDPLFNEIDFKFRPGCFNSNCKPDWPAAARPDEVPIIDYLAKDYDSFRHTMIAAMMQRVPNWQPSSEADLDQVLLELFSAAADELSDYQDRVMNEAYLSSARKRVSLARHARLMDYHIHQGNQATTWLALEVAPAFKSEPETGNIQYFVRKNFQVRAGTQDGQPSSIVFAARRHGRVHELVNNMGLYTWDDAIPSLVAGDTTADLKLWRVDASGVSTPTSDKASAVTVQKLIRSGAINQLLIQEHKNPVTGTENGYNPRKRQLLTLLSGDDGAVAMYDPTTAPTGYDPIADSPPNSAKWFVRVRWAERDKLKSNYCFTVKCTDRKVEDVSLFHGNLVEVSHGLLRTAIFREPGSTKNDGEFYYERLGKRGAICTLPDRPLAYQETKPGGDDPTESTLALRVKQSSGDSDFWDEVPSLVHSDDSDENGDHFVVETDEERVSVIRFGNGRNGKELPQNATVECSYQVGDGLEGNIGLDKLTVFDPTANNFLKLQANIEQTNPDASKIIHCWNPLDVDSGRAPEPAAEIIRRAPEAYRLRQLRAVTLDDYVKRAQELPEVQRASAVYLWTGSWRTVRLTVDPAGTTALEEAAVQKIARHLNAVRLIGEDLEIRAPQFVPLKIVVTLCAQPEFWCEDLQSILEQEFSSGWTPDGRQGFFHPDLWTFGQGIRPSQIVGRVLAVAGAEHIISLTIQRLNAPTSAAPSLLAGAEVAANEIIQVFNDPDHAEKGSIDFVVRGGRQ